MRAVHILLIAASFVVLAGCPGGVIPGPEPVDDDDAIDDDDTSIDDDDATDDDDSSADDDDAGDDDDAVDDDDAGDDDDVVDDDDDGMPDVIVVSIAPDEPLTADDLVATIGLIGGGTPDPAHITWQWLVDSTLRPDLATTTVAASETERGQLWRINVTWDDGSGQIDLESAQVTVGNTAPTATGVTLSPTSVFTDTQVTAIPAGFDDGDGDPPGWSYQWFVAGAPAGGDEGFLASDQFVKGQQVHVEVQPDDGFDLGTAVVSDPVTVLDTPPTAPLISITPTAPAAGMDDLLCAIDTPSSDVDGDFVSYTLSWDVDSVPYPGGGGPWIGPDTTTLPDDTVPGEDTGGSETWTCHALPNDGEEDGPEGQASVTTVAVAMAPDFSLVDDNTTSATYGLAVSPRDYLMAVSGWYFGHST